VHLKDRMIGSAGSLMEVRYGRPSASPDGLVMYPCAVGEGVIPVPVILHNLLAEGYDGYVTVEHFGAARQWDTICESSEYVRTNIA
jgi:sugar phosphate isomerase/epimerase